MGYKRLKGLSWWLSVKESTCNATDSRDVGWIPGSTRSPRDGKGNPLQYFCLGNPMDREAWSERVGHTWATKHQQKIKDPMQITATQESKGTPVRKLKLRSWHRLLFQVSLRDASATLGRWEINEDTDPAWTALHSSDATCFSPCQVLFVNLLPRTA